MSGLDSATRAMRGGRAWARDLAGAVALVEGAIAQRIFLAVEGLELPSHNVFGEPLATERGTDMVDLVRRCGQAAELGERVALVARASELATARSELASIAARRLEVVVHTLAEPSRGDAPGSLAGLAPALALDDLPWGMLLCAGVTDAIDLALVARRAAEDSGCPFFVVHEVAHSHDVEPVAAPSRDLCEAFVGPAQGRARRASAGETRMQDVAGIDAGIDAPPVDDREFAERVPFALGSAMRELESLTGRHHDVIERAPGGDAGLALVGAGALGDSIIADVERLRASGHDVAAVRVVAWRPFPAPRLVKALGRALAVAVLERVDQPLASGPPLAVQLKAAFADALTWAPDYPGIGRIPRIVSGIVAPEREVDSMDLDAIVHNVLADERGKRTFVLGAVGAEESLPAPSMPAAQSSPPSTAAGSFVMRGLVARREVAAAAAELCAAVLASALGLRTRVAVRELTEDEGGGFAFDLAASRHRPRGGHAPHAVGVVAVGDLEVLLRGDVSRGLGGGPGRGNASRDNALSRLARSGVLAIRSDRRAADALWSEVPPWAKAIVFDRGARVVGWTGGGVGGDGTDGAGSGDADGAGAVWLVASTFVGLALAIAASDRALREAGVGEGIDGAVVEREVAEALGGGVAYHAKGAGGVAERGGKTARATFEAIVEVPRTTIERDDDGVRLGRRPRQ
ncbi:MAG TPA: hypothetical protein VH044_20475 [Polyangiaceae bacterium]|nr:hypothetical protein [Polyangiaceae bacterium]